MAAVPFCILPQYLWYNEIILTDEASVNFLLFFKETVMFRNFLVTMVPLKNGMNLRENTTCIKFFTFNGCN